MKLLHIFWSLFIVAILIFLPALFFRTGGKMGGGLELFAYYIVIWIAASVTLPTILIFIKMRRIHVPILMIISLTMVNLYFGALGIYMIYTGQFYWPNHNIFWLFLLNLVFATSSILIIARKEI